MGTTAQKLQAILNSKSDIKDAIEAKGVTVGDAPLDEYAGKIGEIRTGVTEAEENDVNFYDYDGFRVASFTIAQAKALTQAEYNAILPPTHEGLTFQEWNWTLNDIQTYNRQYADIGANYITSDGKTHLKVRPNPDKVTLTLRFKNGTVTVNWGDGTSDTYTRTSEGNTNISHTYSLTKLYEITMSFDASNDDSYYLINPLTQGDFVLSEINLGRKCLTPSNSFYNGVDIKISIPVGGCTSPYTYGSTMRAYVVPKGNDINISSFGAFYQTACKNILPKEVNTLSAQNMFATNYGGRVVVPNPTNSTDFNTGIFNGTRANIISIPNIQLPSNMANFLTGQILIELDIVQGWIPNMSMTFNNSNNWTAYTMVRFFNKLGTTTNAITLTFGSTNLNKLTAEEKAIATNKGYTLA